MKKFYYMILFLMILLSGEISAQFNELVEKGNHFYQSEQYDEAISLYKRVLENGYESAALYYNIGNSYFRTGRLGYAILNYEKALKLNPGDEETEYNLKLANARITDKIKELPEVPILAYWDLIVNSFSLDTWLTVFIIFWLLFLACIALYFLSRRVKMQRLATMIGLFNLTMILIIGIFLISSIHRESTRDYGVLVKSVVTVKTSPDASQSDAFVIHEGIKFQIEEKLNEWTRIKLADGKVGWLTDDTYESI